MLFRHRFSPDASTHQVLRSIEGIGDNAFFALGKPTPWPDDNNPPEVEFVVPETFIYLRAQYLLPAIQSNLGEITGSFRTTQGNQRWHVFLPEDITTETGYLAHPTNIYVARSILYDDYAEASYRAIGLYMGLTLNTNVTPGLTSYLPHQVNHPGIIQWVSYSTPVNRLVNTAPKIEVIL